MTADGALWQLESVSDADFRRYQRIVLEETGIHLSDSKRALLASRLARRLRELGVSSYRRYLQHLNDHADERPRMIDLLLTNETSFFREPAQFTFLSDSVIPAWMEQSRSRSRREAIRVWSAGCATGDEPYSVAMLLRDALEGWTIEILGSDLSTRALQEAEEGVWPIAKAATIPERLLSRFMLRGIGERTGMIKIDAEIRRLVRFRRINLNDPSQTPAGSFDLVLCRNVLIYFEAEARRRVIERLIATCAPGGYLLVGHAETMQGFAGMECVQPTIWRRVS